MSGQGCAHGVTANRVRQADALLRNKPFGRISFNRLASDRILYPFPWIQGHDRPVAAECQNSTIGLHAAPRPSALSTLGTNIAEPHQECVIVGISVQRLKAGDDA